MKIDKLIELLTEAKTKGADTCYTSYDGVLILAKDNGVFISNIGEIEDNNNPKVIIYSEPD